MIQKCDVSGTKFLCSEVIALIRSEVDDICLQIINFEDLSAQPPPPPVAPPTSQTNNRLATRCEFTFSYITFLFILALSLLFLFFSYSNTKFTRINETACGKFSGETGFVTLVVWVRGLRESFLACCLVVLHLSICIGCSQVV